MNGLLQKTMAKIAVALDNVFDHYRIVFWYDTKRELRSEFDQTDGEQV